MRKNSKIVQLLEYSASLKRPGAITRHKYYHHLVTLTEFLPTTTTGLQRLWHVHNNDYTTQRCVVCGNPAAWNKERGGSYRETCSNTCGLLNPNRMTKTKITNLAKYGCESPFGNAKIIAKSKNTVKQRYNVDNVSQIPTIKQQKTKTSRLNWGTDHPLQNTSIRDKVSNTNNERYGHTNYLASVEGQNKTKEFMLNTHGVPFINQCHIPHEVLDHLNDRQWMYEQHFTKELPLTSIAANLGVNDSTVGKYLHKHGFTTQHYFHSTGEYELNEFIVSLGVDTIQGCRKTISSYELDIVIPSCDLAIEYNGLYWHSEQAGKNKQYHQNKYLLCKKQHIQLLTIFEDEWLNNQSQVKRKILSMLHLSTDDIVYGRNTTVVNVDTKTKKTFFDTHHIQGNGPGSINIGLQHKDELVACMSLIRQKDDVFVLNRYATSCRVVGGFSKLLKFFQRTHHWDKLISFADLRWSNGNLYRTTGWTLDKIIPPDYYYSPDGHKRIHKFNYRRKHLPTLLKDFNPLLSERENCDNNGILRIWDCGKQRWIINNPS